MYRSDFHRRAAMSGRPDTDTGTAARAGATSAAGEAGAADGGGACAAATSAPRCWSCSRSSPRPATA